MHTVPGMYYRAYYIYKKNSFIEYFKKSQNI